MKCNNCKIVYNSKKIDIKVTIEGKIYHLHSKQCFDQFANFEISLIDYGKLTDNNDLIPFGPIPN